MFPIRFARKRSVNTTLEQIDAASADINGQKIDRQTYQVAFLADRILEDLVNNDLSGTGQRLGELKTVTNELKMRAFSAGARDLEELCVPLRTVIESLIKSRGKFGKKYTELLAQLSLAIRASVRHGSDGASLARDISKTVIGAGA
jgi:hypothetical protein